jgi:hypothetical protein
MPIYAIPRLAEAPRPGGRAEDRDSLVGVHADIHSPVNTVGWLLPLNLPRFPGLTN